jgi:hypothetical protein
VAAVKNTKAKKGSEWSWRIAGVALCAFFGLGVATGLSGSGRLVSDRAQFLWRLGSLIKRSSFSTVSPLPQTPRPTSNAVALVKRADGFYTLDAAGELRGPVSPTAAGDMPILSGATLGNAAGDRLVEYASVLVRAEAALGAEISEMRVDHDGEAVLYLDRPALPITIDLDHPDSEVQAANRILSIWRGHHDLIAALDMTVPGQGVARLRPAAFEAIKRAKAARVAPTVGERPADHHPTPEVTASR